MAEELNTNRVITLRTEDGKFSFNLGAFAGRISADVFDNNAKGAPAIKHLFTSFSAVQFRVILKKIINDAEAKPITIGSWPFDQNLKQPVFKSNLTVGRDAEGCIYFEMIGDRHKEAVRFYVIPDKSFRINDMELPKVKLTEMGCETIFEIMDHLIEATLYLPAKKQGEGGGYSTSGKTESFSGGSSTEDVPF